MAELPMGMWLFQLAGSAPVPGNSQMASCLTESGTQFGLFVLKNLWGCFRATTLMAPRHKVVSTYDRNNYHGMKNPERRRKKNAK